MVQFEWDPAKSAWTLEFRAFDFTFACQIFDGHTFEFEDDRRPYGERRVVAVGVCDGLLLTVVYTDRSRDDGSVIRRIISSRLSSRKERKQYAESIEEADPNPGQG